MTSWADLPTAEQQWLDHQKLLRAWQGKRLTATLTLGRVVRATEEEVLLSAKRLPSKLSKKDIEAHLKSKLISNDEKQQLAQTDDMRISAEQNTQRMVNEGKVFNNGRV